MLLDCVSAVADPCRGQGRRYPLPYILLFSVLAMLCGATSYRQIQRFIKAHRDRLNEWFGLTWPRAPAPISIRYLRQALDPEEWEQAFRAPSRRLLETPQESNNGPPAIALDGQVLRGSFDRFEDQQAAQILSAFCQAEQLILGHLPVATKTNEIPVAQPLIEERGLSGCCYTLDALPCQKNAGTR